MNRARLFKRESSLFGLFALLLGGCTFSSADSGPFDVASRVNPSLDAQSIARSYQKGFADSYLAMSGSQLNQPFVLGGFERFMAWQRGTIATEYLADNFTALGYFVQSTTSGMRALCDSKREFIALAAVSGLEDGGLHDSSTLDHQQPMKEPRDIVCNNGVRITAIPLGYDAKIFVTSLKNSFANSIDLQHLARASRKANGNLLWSDLNPEWPSRPVQWVFPAQLPFTTHMKRLGIQLPKKFLLASSYLDAFKIADSHPDALVYTYFSPSLYARLQGGLFKILPVQVSRNKLAVAPTPATIASSYPGILKSGIVLYVNGMKKDSCIAFAFADFLLAFNDPILLENNMTPLDAAARRKHSHRIRSLLQPVDKSETPFCRISWQAKYPSAYSKEGFK